MVHPINTMVKQNLQAPRILINLVGLRAIVRCNQHIDWYTMRALKPTTNLTGSSWLIGMRTILNVHAKSLRILIGLFKCAHKKLTKIGSMNK